MRNEVIEFNKTQRGETVKFRAGDVVKVHRKIKEGEKERIQIFEGMVIAMKGGQSSSPMMTVRKVSNGVGIEIVVPIFSPEIKKIELVKRAKVRQSKLYHVREKASKALRFKYTDGSEVTPEKVVEEKKEVVEEEVVAEDTKKSTEKKPTTTEKK